jgi:hypothetical protein
MIVVGVLVIVGILDESLTREVTERVKIVVPIMEDFCVLLQRLHCDGATA